MLTHAFAELHATPQHSFVLSDFLKFLLVVPFYSLRFILFCVCVLPPNVCMYTMCMSGSHRGPKMVLDALELELKE